MRLKQRRRTLLARLNKLSAELLVLQTEAESLIALKEHEGWESWEVGASPRLVAFLFDQMQDDLLQAIEELE